MADPRRRNRRNTWCCSITHPPCKSPDYDYPTAASKHNPKSDLPFKTRPNSVTNDSPQSLKLSFVGKIDPRKILSPGRVSPIDSDPTADQIASPPVESPPEAECARSERSASFRGRSDGSGSGHLGMDNGRDLLDVRLNVRGKRGGSLVLEMSSEILMANSDVLGELVVEYRNGLKVNPSNDKENTVNNGSGSMKVCRIEVPDVENLGVFRDTIELIFVDDITTKLLKYGAYRAISILEVSADLKFTRGALSCLNYLAAVPWTEEEEEKLRRVMTVHNFDEAATRDILDRLYLWKSSEDSQWNLTKELLWSVIACTDPCARNESKALVKGLVSKSSVYEKDQPVLNKVDVYVICQSCLDSLVGLFNEASNPKTDSIPVKKYVGRPLVERISTQVDNINWLLEILLEWQMTEEFVDMWGNQEELSKLHEGASPLFRYELSRVSAGLFIAMGTRRLHCQSESRTRLFKTWFGPMLQDFGWIQRCKKGLDMKVLEEAMGQSLLTLPLKMQHSMFMEWFSHFSKHGSDCINLSKAFQIWWRRSFLRGSETRGVESR
ncbi:BTB/POZ domain-containing protein At2g13690 [Linum perenne]